MFGLLLLAAISLAIAEEFEINYDGSVNADGILSQEYTSKTGSEWEFHYEGNPDENLEIILPKNAVITSVKTDQDYSINYRSSFVIVFENQSTVNVSIFYSIDNSVSFSYWYLLAGFLAVFIIVVIRKPQKKKKPETPEIDVIYDTLNNREKKIIDVLKEKKELKHSILSRLTDIPKASLSRITDSLERKGIIRKEKIGNSTKVVLLKK